MKQPLVSILTPSFNQSEWLADNLTSVRRQTYPHIEHIVMDGGSTDGSIELLQCTSTPPTYWRSESDKGQSHALNKALALSQGSIIGWINSDDAYIDRYAVEIVVETFLRHPEIDVVYGHSLLVNGSNEVLQFLWAPPFIHPLTKFLTPYYQPAVFFRRDILGARMVDESLDYVMDYDLWARLWTTANFKRANCIVGLERHQPTRKVMSPQYLHERRQYDDAHEIDRLSKRSLMLQRIFSTTFRIRALPSFLLGNKGLEAAVPLRWPSYFDRVKLQLATRRSSMHLASPHSVEPL